MSLNSSMPVRYDFWVNRLLDIGRLCEPDAATLRIAQADMFARVLPAILLSNMLSSVVVALVAWRHGWIWFPLAWSTVVVAVGVMALARIRKAKRRKRDKAPSAKFTNRMLIDSAIMAAPWLVMAVVLNPTAVPQMEVLTATLLAGLVCAGMFTMASMPSAALVFSGLILGARIVHILLSPTDYILENLVFQGIYGTVMLVSLRNMA